MDKQTKKCISCDRPLAMNADVCYDCHTCQDPPMELRLPTNEELISDLQRTIGEQADQIGGLTSELEQLRDVYTATAELLQIRKEQAQMLCGQLAKFYAELERARIDAEHMLDAYRDWNNEMAKVQDELARWKMRAHMAETNMRRVSQQLAEEREWHHEALASGQAISNERDALRQQLAASQAETRQVMDDYQDMGNEMGKLQAEAERAKREYAELDTLVNHAISDLFAALNHRPMLVNKENPDALAHYVRLLGQKLAASQAEVAALRGVVLECAEWLESRPDYTEGDAATSSRARGILATPSAAAERVQALEQFRRIVEREIFSNLTSEDTWIQIGKRGLNAIRTALAALDAATVKETLTVEEVTS